MQENHNKNIYKMTTYLQYQLERGSKKYHCPKCGTKKYVPYIESATGDHLPDHFGRCDREANCGYHMNPYKEGYHKKANRQLGHLVKYRSSKSKRLSDEPVFFDFATFKNTLESDRYKENTFLKNLLYNVPFPFSEGDLTKIIELYRLGTVVSGYRAGSITFPFIDVNDNVRAIQVKQFDARNHTTGTDFLHSIIYKHFVKTGRDIPIWLERYRQQDKFVSCLFGEQLLNKFSTNPVALVEAPKTAIYGTLYFGEPKSPDDIIWLAVYNKSSFNLDRLKVLKGRKVFVFPDLSRDGSTYQEWRNKANEFEAAMKGTKFIFSDLLETYATKEQREDGADIGDILINHDHRFFKKTGIAKYQDRSVDEWLQIGLALFTTAELIPLAVSMFAGREHMTFTEISDFLLKEEGLLPNESKAMTNVLGIRKAIKAARFPYFTL